MAVGGWLVTLGGCGCGYVGWPVDNFCGRLRLVLSVILPSIDRPSFWLEKEKGEKEKDVPSGGLPGPQRPSLFFRATERSEGGSRSTRHLPVRVAVRRNGF